MFEFLKRLFTRSAPECKFSEEEWEQYHEAKQKALEAILGPMDDMVLHALIPFYLGGRVDLYCFADGIPGTGFATMELIEPDGSGPKPGRLGAYELVAFTKHNKPRAQGEDDENHPFNEAANHLCNLLTMVGRYAYDAVLNPGDTCEIPMDEGEPNLCLVFDEYDPTDVGFTIDGRNHGLLLVLPVASREMDYAREHGTDELINKLKEAGHYPYSDLDRQPVV